MNTHDGKDVDSIHSCEYQSPAEYEWGVPSISTVDNKELTLMYRPGALAEAN